MNRYSTIPLVIVRIREGEYLIGTKKALVILKNGTCMARTGGGYQSLAEFIQSIE